MRNIRRLNAAAYFFLLPGCLRGVNPVTAYQCVGEKLLHYMEAAVGSV